MIHKISAPSLSGSSAPDIADRILAEALARDCGKPGDDMSVVALILKEHQGSTLVRRMRAEVPLP